MKFNRGLVLTFCGALCALGFSGTAFSARAEVVVPAGAQTSSVNLLYDVNGSIAGYSLVAGLTFATNDSRLSDVGKLSLGKLYQALATNSTAKISIFGYSDSTGVHAHNLALSLARAQSVRNLLLMMGLSRSRIVEVKGLAEIDPVADNATDAGRQANRRVELHILGKAAIRRHYVAPKPKPKAMVDQNQPERYDRFGIGLGYPDVRVRWNPGMGLGLEGKFSFEQGIQVYSGRLYWSFAHWQDLMVEVGAEGGYAHFNAIDTINGYGYFGEPFLAVECPLGSRMRLEVDGGPARVAASSEGFTYTQTDFVLNTALYIYFF